MTPSSPSRAVGSPVYVSAHGIAVVKKVMAFPDAYNLAELVLTKAGGPVPVGRGMKKAVVARLSAMGYVAFATDIPDSWAYEISTRRLDILNDGVDEELPSFNVRVERAFAAKPTMYVVATPEGIDLVLDNLPERPPEPGLTLD